MEFAFGAMAGGLAALAGTLRQGSTKKPAAGNKLRNTGTQVTFGGREEGAGKDIAHFLSDNNIQEQRESSPQHNANMLPVQPQAKKPVKT